MSETSYRERLIQAYNRMMERLHARLAELEKAEQEVLPTLQHGIEHAAETAVTLGELTRQEARLIGAYLKRDLHDAGHHLATTGHELSAWLRFDLDQVEERLLELFSRAADRTRLELLDLAETAARTSDYWTGEITGPGSLQCDACGEILAFRTTSAIPACPRCGATQFSRVAARTVDKGAAPSTDADDAQGV